MTSTPPAPEQAGEQHEWLAYCLRDGQTVWVATLAAPTAWWAKTIALGHAEDAGYDHVYISGGQP